MKIKDIRTDGVYAVKVPDHTRKADDGGIDDFVEIRAMVIGRIRDDGRTTDRWDVITADGAMTVRTSQFIDTWETYMADVAADAAREAVINAFEDAGWISPDTADPTGAFHRMAIFADNDATARTSNGRIVIEVTPDMAQVIAEGIRRAATDMDSPTV
ncbi:hypothetical protein DVS28_b0234 (plasmid) [Euzebya pacifica]|uniref:Uncharacterized protein n=1 Tax=Euzebya pacifica TaxID=1608957 RepID=A0A346Y6A7_9ACTN|nr:hypothetical protein [Euzebya pacifica]AXV10004.1 hypothetical protein DVS28_b0234 [Euzebya pacifica]